MTFEIDYLALSPELIVIATMVTVLALDLMLPRPKKYWTATVAVAGTALALVPLAILAFDGEVRSMFDGSYVVDEFALVLKSLFLVAAYIVFLMSHNYIESERYYQGEYYFLLLASVLGSLVMASSRDLIILFIGIELVTGPLYMLAGWRKGDVKSNEASMKYFIIGILSTAILLYGMSFLYGLTGEITFSGLAEATAGMADEPALIMAVLLVIVGFGFKISAVPFHFWAPDTYEGAPTPITAYLSVNSKAAGFVAMLLVMYLALPGVTDVWGPALWLLAALSMTIANLAALRQTNIVRLLAYSSVAQAGFMLVPFAAAGVAGADLEEAFAATVIYLVIYALMNLGAFAVVIAGARKTRSGELSAWSGLARVDPKLGVLIAVFFFSLAGIPPLAGWFAKFAMFRSVMIAGGTATVVLAVIAAINAVIALYYYAKVVKSVWLDDPIGELADDVEPVGSLSLALGITVVLTVVIGFLPALATFAGDAARVIASGS
ncbi:MAG: NADH-quinone oxidoreductase subunit N [Actinobacteria bacterium]|nr:NADH-quinone oxidoreductase subunit N [Actinomycetota bacterium]MCZ6567465.1 NADH-quinone oxidoreductase subunit N [Actinomycetota bacterium]MCZ6630571.1 NADH-quinone oxidoreductase subunit N [Actinomycetota bacterium]MCZ6737554.1 NADH-quinone oxidoreductase subunit N [Actinomycetota bacterium]